MKKFSTLKSLSLLILSLISSVNITRSQTPTNCLEIESILADACGSPEGENEMVRFKVGPSPLATSNISVNWPSNPYLGISPVNATTTNAVNALNATIVSCGYLLQPVGNVIPAGKTVLLITSTNISLAANSFANLTDTLYVIFQNAGNTNGHFANYSTPSGLRTLLISTIAPVCSDAVTYDKVLLINQSGGYGGTTAQKDGATIVFDWNGTTAYINNGCQAPITTNTANAGPNVSICPSGTVTLNGTASGNYTGVIWQGGAGSFSSANSLATNYTSSTSESGTITLSLGVIGSCNDTVFNTVDVTINPAPVMTSANSASVCSGTVLNFPLTSDVTSVYSWTASDNINTSGESLTTQTSGNINNTLINNSASAQTVVYTVTPTSTAGSCQGATQTINITVNPTPVMTSSNAATICSGATASILLTSNISSSYSWLAADNINTNGESLTSQNSGILNNTITNNTSSSQTVVYTVIPTATTGGCSGAAQSININVNPLPAMTNAAAGNICSGNTINIPLTSNISASYSWIASDNSNTSGESLTTQTSGTLNNTLINNGTSSQTVLYTVTPTSTTGSCVGASQTVSVIVNPTPVMTSSGSAVLCSGSSVNILLTSDIASSYSWIAADNTNTTGESLTSQTSSTLSNTLVNNSLVPETVVYTVTPTSSGGGCVGASQTISITVDPIAVISGTPVITSSSCGSSDGSITGLSASGPLTLTYTWTNSSATVVSTSSTTADLTNQPAGNYTLVVTSSANSCSVSSGPYAIGNAGAPPAPTAGSNAPLCEGTTLDLTSTTVSGAIYNWTGPNGFASTQQNPTVTSNSTTAMSGSYFVTVTIAGCTSLPGNISVIINPLPSASITPAGSTTFCAGNSVTLNGSGTGTSFLWMPGSITTSSISTASAGTYMYIATNSCGTDTASQVITVSPLPTAVITASGATTFCSGDSVTLMASGVGTYSWSTGGSASSISVLAAGTYTLTSTNGCGSQQTTQTISVNPLPVATITPAGNTTFCAGNSVVLNGAGTGSSFIWMPGSTTTSSISVANAGTYLYIATNSCGSDTASQTITVNPLPTAVITPSGATSLCSGSSVTLTASGTGTYSWSTGSTANSINVSTAGTYTLTSTNSCGTQQATQTVTIISFPTASITPSGNTDLCSGESVTLNAAGGDTYLWSTGTTGTSINVNAGGNYSVTASNVCGTDIASITVTVDSVNALFSADVITGTYPLTVNFSNNSSANASSHQWNFGDGTGSASLSPSNTYQAPGTYNAILTVSNINGCTDSYTITIIVLENPSFLQMPNVFTPNGDSNNDNFAAMGEGIKQFNCKIYDRWGLLLTELASFESKWDGRTNSGTISSDGTYFYTVKASGLDGMLYDLSGFVQLIGK